MDKASALPTTEKPMNACRHLDHDKERYPSCDLVQAPGMDVKYWFRREVDPTLPQKVQFCKLRGRINDVFSCYEGERSCHEPAGTDPRLPGEF